MIEHQTFTLTESIHQGLRKGSVGTIVHIYNPKNIEGEFTDEDGNHIETCIVQTNIIKLRESDA